jgi:type I restriction enzyme S subunit
MAQALFRSWFVDFDPVLDKALAAGHDIPEPLQAKAQRRLALGDQRKPLPPEVEGLFPDRFVYEEEVGWVPEGWVVKPLDQWFEINPRISLPKGTEAKYLEMKGLPTEGYSASGSIKKEYKGGAKFQNGDVLLARITPCLENGKTGIVDFLDEGEIGFGSTEFIVMRGKGGIQTPFVACLARDDQFRKHCIQSMVGSSGRQRVQHAAFSNFHLAIPGKPAVLKTFHGMANQFFTKMTRNSEESEVLNGLRDTLLPKLISGELRING